MNQKRSTEKESTDENKILTLKPKKSDKTHHDSINCLEK